MSIPAPLVLVVEDSPEVAQLLVRTLVRQGYRVQLAPTLSAAAGSLETEHPQLITLDLQLPDGSGLALLHQLRADPATATIPVVIISGSVGAESDVYTQAQAVLAKPFSTAELSAAVRRVAFPLSPPNAVHHHEVGGGYA